MGYDVSVFEAFHTPGGVLSYGGTMYINLVRNICEPELELHLYRVLHRLGLHIKAESNQR